MVSDEEIISEAIKHKGDCQRPYEPCDRCILEAINLTREKVFKQLEDNSIKAVLPANRIHVCIREDIFVNLKSVQFAGKR